LVMRKAGVRPCGPQNMRFGGPLQDPSRLDGQGSKSGAPVRVENGFTRRVQCSVMQL
jgi:hypothetical protein